MRRVEIRDNDSHFTHKVLTFFRYWNAWTWSSSTLTQCARRCLAEPDLTDEASIEFAQHAGGIKMSEDRQILDMMIQRKTGEITLNLTDEQYAKVELGGGGGRTLRIADL